MNYYHLLKHYKTCSEAARVLDLSRQTVNAWRFARIPSIWQARISNRTGLRADVRTLKEATEFAKLLGYNGVEHPKAK